jgi:hypothetical protein
MKKIIMLLLMLVLVGCKKEATPAFQDTILEPTVAPTATSFAVAPATPIVVSPAESAEEQVAQSIERAASYKFDVYDVRLLNDNTIGLPLKPAEEFPTVVIIIHFTSSSEGLTPAENQLVWEAVRAGVQSLAGPNGVTGFYYFFTHSGDMETLKVINVTDTSTCQSWPGVAPLPPEALRFRGF